MAVALVVAAAVVIPIALLFGGRLTLDGANSWSLVALMALAQPPVVHRLANFQQLDVFRQNPILGKAAVRQ